MLNLDTGKITAQYHIIIDDWFQTVNATSEDRINFDHDDWYKTFGLTPWQYVPDEADEPVQDEALVTDSEGAERCEELRAVRDAFDIMHGPLQPAVPHTPQPTQ